MTSSVVPLTDCRAKPAEERARIFNIQRYSLNDGAGIRTMVFFKGCPLHCPWCSNPESRSREAAFIRREAKCIHCGTCALDVDECPSGAYQQMGTDYTLDELLREVMKDEVFFRVSGGGVTLSGGEAQKIAIARALYKDAPFIILDEPTAALDPIAEAEIYSKFDEIAGNKTAIYISHRLSSCKFCDEIAVFHEGAVIQQGSHAELLADRGGKYYALWNAQAQYYTE